MAPSSENGVITVSWDYVHTGGLNLTSVQILSWSVNGHSVYSVGTDCTSNCVFSVAGLKAGFSYIFAINSSNSEGSVVVKCPEVIHSIGEL